jgi:hypothetical protein
MKSPQIKWIDGIAMSAFAVFIFIASMLNFNDNQPSAGLVFLGLSAVAGMVAVKNFKKKSGKT